MPREIRSERTLEAWESWVDQAIRDAQERGEFSNLPGEGQPVQVDRNPLAGDRELGFHVLRNADVLPAWMELARDVSSRLSALDTMLEQSRDRFDRLRQRACRSTTVRPADERGSTVLRWLRGGFPEWRSDHAPLSVGRAERERQDTRARYLQRAAAVDKQIKEYNAALPDDLRWLERPRLLPEHASARFDAACPPITCTADGQR